LLKIELQARKLQEIQDFLHYQEARKISLKILGKKLQEDYYIRHESSNFSFSKFQSSMQITGCFNGSVFKSEVLVGKYIKQKQEY
jgi:hypothetical protein